MDGGGYDAFYGYVSGESTAGFIYRRADGGEQRFFPLWAEGAGESPPAFLPRKCTVCDSNAGLLLCSRPGPVPLPCRFHLRLRSRRKRRRRRPFLRRYSYLVCNPFFRGYRRYVRIPPSGLGPHRARIPRALVVVPHPARPGYLFYVVCALPTPTAAGCYSFEVYNSYTDRWRAFRPHALGGVRADTGVSCGTKAYWLRRDAPLAVFYDAGCDAVGAVRLPDAYAAPFGGVRLRSQLGKQGDRLCFVAATEDWRAAYADSGEGDGTDRWVCWREWRYAFGSVPAVPRFQDGCRLQVTFWYGSGNVSVWDGRRGGPEPIRTVCLPGLPQRDRGADVLPVIATDCHPVMHFLLESEWMI